MVTTRKCQNRRKRKGKFCQMYTFFVKSYLLRVTPTYYCMDLCKICWYKSP